MLKKLYSFHLSAKSCAAWEAFFLRHRQEIIACLTGSTEPVQISREAVCREHWNEDDPDLNGPIQTHDHYFAQGDLNWKLSTVHAYWDPDRFFHANLRMVVTHPNYTFHLYATSRHFSRRSSEKARALSRFMVQVRAKDDPAVRSRLPQSIQDRSFADVLRALIRAEET